MSLRHKVGDKVRIRQDLKIGEVYDGVPVREEMVKFAGKVMTIENVYEDCYGNIDYYLEEDRSAWYWTESMFIVSNADKIRNMDDEELAEFLRKVTLGAASRDVWTEWLTSNKWER